MRVRRDISNILLKVLSPLSRIASCADKPRVWSVRLAAACVVLIAYGAGAQQAVVVHDASGVSRDADSVIQARRVRAQRFAAERVGAPGVNAAEALERARAQALHANELHPMSSSFGAAWQALGPSTVLSPTYGNLTGRVTAVAVDPNDTTGNTVYLGTTGGGVWKSTNAAGPLGAATFAPLTDTLPVFSQSAGASVIPSLSIGAVAVQPMANGVVMAGTGDPNDATDSLYGEGLLRSADGGATWTLVQLSHDGANGLHSFVGLSAAGLAWSSANTSLVVAGFSNSPLAAEETAATAESVAGIYYSTDAGVTWQMATLYDGASVVQTPQPIGAAQAGNPVTSVVWDALRGSFYAAVRGHGYYASTDGANWTRMAAQPGTKLTTANCPVVTNAATCPIFRGTLAVQPATGDLYALTVDGNDLDQGLWQDLCAAANGVCADHAPVFAARIDGGALEVGSGSTAIAQGDYNLALSAAPAAGGGTDLFVGTADLYRCGMGAGATSCALRNTTNAVDGCHAPAAVAASQHALAAVAQAGGEPILFVGNDGGLWRSMDGVAETGSVCSASDAAHFDNLNAAIGVGGSLAEVVGFAEAPADANTLIAGLGANGSAATTAASTLAPWAQLSAGEGGYPSIDPETPTEWYAAIGAGVNVKQCALGANCLPSSFTAPATVGEAQVGYDEALVDAPTMLDPGLTANLLAGTCRVWRGQAGTGTTWSSANAISAAFGGGAVPCTAASPMVRSLGAGGAAVTSANAQNSGSEVLYAGLAGELDGGTATLGGHVFTTATANIDGSTSAWKDVAASPVLNDTADAGVFNPYGFDVSSVVVDGHDATGGTVYATVMGFGAGAVPHVYRSVDFGAHWLNVSANLPDAPANALVVDPNDANTVYVATDAGVYATQAMGTCATASCWNLLGTGLPNAPVTSLAAAAGMATGDGRLGVLRAGTYGRGIWGTPLLAAVSVAAPGVTLSAASLTFGAQQVATVSAAQTLTVTSSGSSPLTVSSIAVSGDFSETDTCAGETLAVNTTCAVTVVFTPTATGARAGTLTVFANVSGGQASVALSGTGSAAASVVLTPGALSFAATTVNQTAAAQTMTLANTGGSAASLQTPVVSGDFAIAANTCGSSLAIGTACTVAVSFTPTASGTRSGLFSIADSAGTQSATLVGVGNAPATDALTPGSLSFGQQTVGTVSAASVVTLTNAGDVALTLITAASSSNAFAVTNGCGATLAGHATCAISVVFAPTAVGAQTATLTVSDAFRSQTVALSGTGLAGAGVSLTPVSLAFGAVGVGLTSAAQVLTLTNNGGAALTVSSVAVSGDFAIAANTCGKMVAVAQACSLTMVFAPTVAGTRVGTVTLVDSAVSGTQTVALSGTGIDFTLAANGATSATIAASGGSASFPMLLTALGGVSASASLGCSGAPAHTTCVVTPSAATLGSALTVSAVVSTGIATASVGAPREASPWMRGAGEMLALAMPWMLLGVRGRRARRYWLGLVVLAVMGAAVVGCGTGRTVPTDSGGTTAASTPTPTGTYTLTVSASSNGVTHSVPVTVTVQ